MQKLKFINGNGVEVDLTDKVNYGIIEWDGFSADGLNIQSQQVPFQDGGVFLDALMEQRELSVTVAMNAKGDLDKRYRLRRELISVLNPKLGEGVLIYTDNYLSKQIHVIPQIPLFDTNNSNDSGSPKVSCSFTACNPYWEDLEESFDNINQGGSLIINNNGDIDIGIKVNLINVDSEKPILRNQTTGKYIELDENNINGTYKINTEVGKKSVNKYNLEYLYNNGGLIKDVCTNGADILYSGSLDIYEDVNGEIKDSFFSLFFSQIIYGNGYFVGVTGNKIYKSSNGVDNWQYITSISSLQYIYFAENIFLFVSYNAIKKSTDLTNFEDVNILPSGYSSVNFSGSRYNRAYINYANGKYIIGAKIMQSSVNKYGVLVFNNDLTSVQFVEVQGLTKDDIGFKVLYNNGIYAFSTLDYLNYPSKTFYSNNNLESFSYIAQRYNIFCVFDGFFVGAILDDNDCITITFSQDIIHWNYTHSEIKAKVTLNEMFIIYNAEVINGCVKFVGRRGLILETNDLQSLKTIGTMSNYIAEKYVKKNDECYCIGNYCQDGTNKRCIMKVSTSNVNEVDVLYEIPANWSYCHFDCLNNKFLISYLVISGNTRKYYIIHSDNAENWSTPIEMPFSSDQEFMFVNGTYYVIDFYESTIYHAYKSNNLETWNVWNNSVRHMYYFNSKYYGFYDDSPNVFISSDDENWEFLLNVRTLTIYDSRAKPSRIISQKNTLIIFTQQYTTDNVSILYSLDGYNFQLASSHFFNDVIQDVNYFSRENVILLALNNTVVKSYDGINWIDSNIQMSVQIGLLFSFKDILIIQGFFDELFTNTYSYLNKIDKLSKNSDIGLKLTQGRNKIALGCLNGKCSAIISYRQKYIGV